MTFPHIPIVIQELYDIYDYRHASAILKSDFSDEFDEICDALSKFSFMKENVIKPGGNESDIPKIFSGLLRPKHWDEKKLTASLVVNEKEVVSTDTHKIDYLKNRVALDLEWNSKDQTYDRDLAAFRTFFEYNKISVGIIITRSNDLDDYFKSLGTYFDKYRNEKKYTAKYGASTTHCRQLIRRLKAGRSGGCPVLAFGITKKLIKQ